MCILFDVCLFNICLVYLKYRMYSIIFLDMNSITFE